MSGPQRSAAPSGPHSACSLFFDSGGLALGLSHIISHDPPPPQPSCTRFVGTVAGWGGAE